MQQHLFMLHVVIFLLRKKKQFSILLKRAFSCPLNYDLVDTENVIVGRQIRIVSAELT